MCFVNFVGFCVICCSFSRGVFFVLSELPSVKLFLGENVKHYGCLVLFECIISVFVGLLLVTVGDSYSCFGVISCGLCHFLGFWRR